jgi:hypothetical protein
MTVPNQPDIVQIEDFCAESGPDTQERVATSFPFFIGQICAASDLSFFGICCFSANFNKETCKEFCRDHISCAWSGVTALRHLSRGTGAIPSNQSRMLLTCFDQP